MTAGQGPLAPESVGGCGSGYSKGFKRGRRAGSPPHHQAPGVQPESRGQRSPCSWPKGLTAALWQVLG